ncbi:MAG: ATP-binding cassette domain-containing protein [Acidobacteriia bacterium]|nr:ATP-binding cassette domain-containing protein [Terriglobia bacterium]
MSESVIHVEGLGKRYRVGERERYLALRDVLARAVAAPFRRNGQRRTRDFLWALRDVSFDVRQGEVVGLIGRNGAGKTTLLKILSRITRPTEGFAEIHGRVGSLLEVGTGFHPELTGRENVYLSGAILGMSKREIGRKYDAIVDFAGVERFIDTPLKHFSTGMQMRLAFAVAAHLEPEILLVDEVLAVGDLEFQKKCLGKMQEVSESGRTIVFVSHQMNQIRRLCERVLWIDAGQIRESGPTGEVIAAYETSQVGPAAGGRGKCFLRWEVPGHGNVVRQLADEVVFRFELELAEPVSKGHLGVNIVNGDSVLLVGWGFENVEIPAGRQELTVRVPFLPLRPGAYTLLCTLFNRGNNLTDGEAIEHWSAVPPLVVDTQPVTHTQDRWAGVLNIPAELQVPSTDTVRTTVAES